MSLCPFCLFCLSALCPVFVPCFSCVCLSCVHPVYSVCVHPVCLVYVCPVHFVSILCVCVCLSCVFCVHLPVRLPTPSLQLCSKAANTAIPADNQCPRIKKLSPGLQLPGANEPEQRGLVTCTHSQPYTGAQAPSLPPCPIPARAWEWWCLSSLCSCSPGSKANSPQAQGTWQDMGAIIAQRLACCCCCFLVPYCCHVSPWRNSYTSPPLLGLCPPESLWGILGPFSGVGAGRVVSFILFFPSQPGYS